MENILLLGGFGFIGTNIINYIDINLSDKYSVIVVDRHLKHPQNLSFDCISKIYAGEFSDELFIRSIFDDNKIDIVIHSLSATVPAFSENACFDIDANLKPTVELLSILSEYKVYKIVYISSGGAIYGENNSLVKHNENENVFPKSSYGIVKLTIEKYLYQYQCLHNIQPLILRLSNPYGPYHYSLKQGVVNVALDRAINGTSFSVWGDGQAQKDYIYIEDFCNILFQLVDLNAFNKIINIGSGISINIDTILFKINCLLPTFSWVYNKKNELDVTHLELDISYLKSIIGDYDFTPFEDGLVKTLNWLNNNNFTK